MKKITAILLLSLFLFNWIGYRLLTSILEKKADVQLQTQLDENHYEDAQLISVKAPVTHLSYFHNSPVFEITSGKIEIGGVLYKYVKRRIYNDSLEVLCIPDQTAMQIKTAGNNFFICVNGLQHTGSGPEKRQSANAGFFKEVSPDYYPTQDIMLSRVVCVISLHRHADRSFILSPSHTLTPEQPPESLYVTA